MANYQEERVELTNTQLSKLKSATKNKKGAILRLNKKNNKLFNSYGYFETLLKREPNAGIFW